MIKGFMQYVGGTLVPYYLKTAEELRGIKEGTIVNVSITVPRNLGHHKLYWKMIEVIFKAQIEPIVFPEAKLLHKEIKIALGYVEKKEDYMGNKYWEPLSTSFEKMDNADFCLYWDNFLKFALEKIVPHMTKKGLEDELYHLIGERGPSDT